MPTGYTADVESGKITEVKDYIMTCSRAFGALIHMREDSFDYEITDCVPSDYNKKELEKTKEKMESLINMSDSEIQLELDELYESTLKSNQEYYNNGKEQNDRYLRMLSKVAEWIPPTEEHSNIKEFAMEQIRTSMSTYYKEYENKTPTRLTVEKYKKEEMNRLLKLIEYYSKGHKEEIDRCNKRNEWVKQLRDSL